VGHEPAVPVSCACLVCQLPLEACTRIDVLMLFCTSQRLLFVTAACRLCRIHDVIGCVFSGCLLACGGEGQAFGAQFDVRPTIRDRSPPCTWFRMRIVGFPETCRGKRVQSSIQTTGQLTNTNEAHTYNDVCQCCNCCGMGSLATHACTPSEQQPLVAQPHIPAPHRQAARSPLTLSSLQASLCSRHRTAARCKTRRQVGTTHRAVKTTMQTASVAMLTIQNWPTVCVMTGGIGTFSPRMPADGQKQDIFKGNLLSAHA
jgi:hypothetical protein